MKSTTYIFFISLVLLLNSCADTFIGDEGQLDEDVFSNYQTKTELELPFEDEWYIVWGGRSVTQNKHFVNRHERYAMDILIGIDGKSHSGDGNENEDYYCFGKRLNAPGDGKIVALENNNEDNIPGVRVGTANYIIIDHLNGEFSYMGHFKQHSIVVSVGDTVVKGQEVGKVGNSGRSTEPHLHYHMQTTSEGSTGLGLPTQFLNYYADNVLIEKGEPVRAQKVRKIE